MPVYEYTALNVKGKTISGIIDAESATAARRKLRVSKVFPTDIRETRETQPRTKSWVASLSRSFARVRPSEIAQMTRQLATLIGAGFPLVTALDTLIPHIKSQGFKKVMAGIKDAVVEGNSFAGALSLYPGVFTPLYINMVRAGESSGTLEIVMDRLADITEKQQALKSRIRSALAYPVLMACIGILVLFFLITFIVPSIAGIFTDMNRVLPAPTRILIGTSEIFKNYWWVLVGLIFLIFIGIHQFKKTRQGRRVWDRMMLRLPLLGGLINKLAAARFTRTLGSLLENGVTMLGALDIVGNIVSNIHLSNAIQKASEDVGKGQGLAVSISDSGLFPPLAVQMILVGEQSGELEPMLQKVAEVYENEVETTVMSMTSLLEPIMILVMAVLVGFIVLSICLPIFEMNELIR